jgi:hypothetical protein
MQSKLLFYAGQVEIMGKGNSKLGRVCLMSAQIDKSITKEVAINRRKNLRPQIAALIDQLMPGTRNQLDPGIGQCAPNLLQVVTPGDC